MSFKYHIDENKYRVKPEQRYIRINGWGFETNGGEIEYITILDGQRVKSRVKLVKRKDVIKKHSKYQLPVENGFHIKTYIEEETPQSYQLYMSDGTKRKKILDWNQKDIMCHLDDSTISYNIDTIHLEKKKIMIGGWATSVNGNDAVKMILKDQEGNAVDFKIQKKRRSDLVDLGLIEEINQNCGFSIESSWEEGQVYTFILSDGTKKKHITIDTKEVLKKQKIRSRVGFAREALKHAKPSAVKEIITYVKANGFADLKEFIVTRVNTAGKPYKEWIKEHIPSDEELKEQRREQFEKAPKISIIVPTYKTPVKYLKEMIESVRKQSYSNWELCIADGSEGDQAVERELETYSQLDSRIKYKLLEKNLGIAGNTNGALELVTGDYIGLFDHDDVLTPNALYEVVRALQEDDYDILYTDEDKMNGEGTEFMDPNFKPDFSMDLFRSHNYITHFFVVKTAIMNKIGGFRSEYDGSQDYDLMFRCIENADKIKHIPMILYHWRIHMNSVAGDPASKMYAYDAGKRAIEDHLKRMNIDAEVDHVGLWGMYHVKYAIQGTPLISIIIPNKDHIKDLDTCIRSLYEKSTYQNFEIIIVENNSEEKETSAYYERLEELHHNVSVVTWDGSFNYSAINNYGVGYAKGEYLLFLNNDTELITPEGIEEMLGCCMRDDVGAVGAKLLYEDDTVQHAGVVVGFGNYAGHVNTGIGREDYGYMVRARISCNYSAVTAACLLTKTSLFHRVGGFDEQFEVACNDVDYCLKLRELNQLIVFNAFSEWYHYESKSRGYEDTDEKVRRFENEVEKFQKKWQKVLDEGDPFYNKNFPVTQAPFTLG